MTSNAMGISRAMVACTLPGTTRDKEDFILAALLEKSFCCNATSFLMGLHVNNEEAQDSEAF